MLAGKGWCQTRTLDAKGRPLARHGVRQPHSKQFACGGGRLVAAHGQRKGTARQRPPVQRNLQPVQPCPPRFRLIELCCRWFEAVAQLLMGSMLRMATDGGSSACWSQCSLKTGIRGRKMRACGRLMPTKRVQGNGVRNMVGQMLAMEQLTRDARHEGHFVQALPAHGVHLRREQHGSGLVRQIGGQSAPQPLGFIIRQPTNATSTMCCSQARDMLQLPDASQGVRVMMSVLPCNSSQPQLCSLAVRGVCPPRWFRTWGRR